MPDKDESRKNGTSFRAVILDLDGVVTRTARLHSRAWKRTFDEYRQERVRRGDEPFEEFDEAADYLRHVDGKPRYEGVKSFLRSRDIDLPQGHWSDDPSRETVCGLGNRKNVLFNKILEEQGAEVFDDAVERIHEWRRRGLKTAVVSSSRNCSAVLESVGLTDLFDAQVDGVEARRLNLAGKPRPDTFLEAARRLDVEPARAVLVEDAIVGVQAGRAGEFGLVVGVDRKGDGTALRENGADLTVRNLKELDI